MVTRAQPQAEVRVVERGPVPRGAAAVAREKVGATLKLASEPVLDARVRLELATDPAVERKAVAQANVDVNGRPVRVQVAAPTMREAIDALADRLRLRLEDLDRHWQAIRGGVPRPELGEWRRSSPPTVRPGHFPRPPEERELITRSSYATHPMTVDEAVVDLDLLDYGFLLFTEAATGQDAVLEREGSGFRLHLVRPVATETLGAGTTGLSVVPVPAPRLTVDDAQQRLDATGAPFVFFVDTSTGRGRVLHLRYDGHYGLVTATV